MIVVWPAPGRLTELCIRPRAWLLYCGRLTSLISAGHATLQRAPQWWIAGSCGAFAWNALASLFAALVFGRRAWRSCAHSRSHHYSRTFVRRPWGRPFGSRRPGDAPVRSGRKPLAACVAFCGPLLALGGLWARSGWSPELGPWPLSLFVQSLHSGHCLPAMLPAILALSML